MTAAEIRELDCRRLETVFLREIAAQLAELNERLGNWQGALPVALCASNDSIPVVLRER